MPSNRAERLSKLISAFSFNYSIHVQDSGALCQLWLPDASGSLTTQGSPYSIMGVSDYLALYKFVSAGYRPSCNGHNEACPISRVFVGLQPQLVPDSNSAKPHMEFDRQAEAQRCHIRSNLLLPIFDARLPEDSDPAAVFELAQHEEVVDFSVAVNALKDAAQPVDFFIPSLQTADSVDACEVPLEPLQPSGSNGSSFAAAGSKQQQDTCTSGAPSTGPLRRLPMRRSSCLIAKQQPEPGLEGVEDPGQGLDQQQEQCGKPQHSTRRPSVIVTDHYTFDDSDGSRKARHASCSGIGTAAAADGAGSVQADAGAAAASLSLSCASLSLAASDAAAAAQAADACSSTPYTAGIMQQGYVAGLQGNMTESPALLRSSSQAQKSVHFSPLPEPHAHNSSAQQQQQQQPHSMPLPAVHAYSNPALFNAPMWQQEQVLEQQQYSTPLPYCNPVLFSSQSWSQQQLQPQQQHSLEFEMQRLQLQLQLQQFGNDGAFSSQQDQQQQFPQQFGLLEQQGSDGRLPRGQSYSVIELAAAASFNGCDSSDRNCYSGEFAVGRFSSGSGRAEKIRALVAHSGRFRHKGLGGMFEYVGGAQKLMLLNRAHGISELQEQLCGASGPLGVPMRQGLKVKYALPGGDTTQLLDLETDADLELMWDEYDDFLACGGKSSAKLQLYVESSTSSSRGSGGSDSSGAQSPFLRAASAYLQPDTPTVSSGMPSTGAMAGTSSGMASRAGSQHGPLVDMLPYEAVSSAAAAVAATITADAAAALPTIFSAAVRPDASTAVAMAPADAGMRGAQCKQRDQLKQLVTELHGKMEVMTPEQIDIVRFLGGGAFGEVYLARWHGTEVAVKCLSASLITSGQDGAPCMQAVSELLKEAGMLASLRHPNIVSVFGVVLPPVELIHDSNSDVDDASSNRATPSCPWDSVFSHTGAAPAFGSAAGSTCIGDALMGQSNEFSGGQQRSSLSFMSRSVLAAGHPPAPAVVTEYMAAGSLRQAISTGAGWLQNNMAKVKMLLDTARGLDYLHSKRLVHFDLKSANLLVTMKDKVPCVKIADMGLTKARNQTFVTGVDSVRGTLPWIAPEIVKHPHWGVTEAADIYSFGVIMWEIWTGQEPFDNVPLHALLHQLASPEGLSLPVPGTPDWEGEACCPEPAPGWSSVMQQCWLSPQQRPTARQLVAALGGMMDTLRSMRRSDGRQP